MYTYTYCPSLIQIVNYIIYLVTSSLVAMPFQRRLDRLERVVDGRLDSYLSAAEKQAATSPGSLLVLRKNYYKKVRSYKIMHHVCM